MSNKILSKGEVEDVLKMLKHKIPQRMIANKFGVGSSTISDIHTGKTWDGVEREEVQEVHSCIMSFGDLHAPYHHRDALDFLYAVKGAYKPTTVVDLGDTLDSHSLSFYPTEISLDNATKELATGREVVQELASIFPRVTVVDSNHTSRAYRVAKKGGIPKELILPYEDILGVRDYNWKFVRDLTLTLPNGEDVFFTHNAGSNCFLTSQRMGCSVVAGHVHSKSFIQWWATNVGKHFAMQVGCLIDGTSPAFSYNLSQILRPQLTCSVIKDSNPLVIQMNLDEGGRWDGQVC